MSFDIARADTICAVATGDAASAIAVVRVSGPRAHEVCERVFRPRRGLQRDFVATLGDVVDGAVVVDEALCTRFPAGRSYTGEASFELSIHGGPVQVRATLRALVGVGCRLAEAGEFTMRAVLSGRMNLVQAEAVDDVIAAKTEAAAQAALRALKGGLSSKIDPVREAIVDTLAEIEARLDFPDEDLGDTRLDEIVSSLRGAADNAADLLARSRYGRLLHDGARVVLYGPPNAGKSTLLNALAGEERALVHDEPGTTRDVLEAHVDVGGVAVTLVDVAGVRPLAEAGAVEKMGIARAESERQRADLVLALVPLAPDIDATEAIARARALGGDIVVLTKADLASAHGAVLSPAAAGEISRVLSQAAGAVSYVVTSAKTGLGLAELRAAIAQKLGHTVSDGDEALLMRERQVEQVRECHEALGAAVDALEKREAGEVVASELRRAARALDRLLGRDVGEDVLDRVFSRFCIGK